MNVIYLAYDWYGPTGKYRNNQYIRIDSDLKKIKTHHTHDMYFYKLGGFEPRPSILLADHDTFLYTLELNLAKDSWILNPDISLLSLTSMQSGTLNQIRKFNGFILLNMANEYLINENILLKLHASFINDEIPLNKVILQTGNPGLKLLYDNFCTKCGVGKQNRIHIASIEYFEFEVSKLMSDLEKNETPRVLNYDVIQKTFLCFNRHHRYHRNNFLLLFYNENLLKDSYFSMPKLCPSSDTSWVVGLENKYIDDIEWSEQIITIDDMLPLTLDIADMSDSGILTQTWGEKDVELYKTSLISVITETLYKENEIFLTEKTFKPISYRHPFIILGAYKFLSYLKSLGYKTFNDIEDPEARMAAVIQLCRDINNKTDAEKKLIFYKTMFITEHNYKLLKSIYTNVGQRVNFILDFRNAWMHHGGGKYRY